MKDTHLPIRVKQIQALDAECFLKELFTPFQRQSQYIPALP
jgi:hypothetical protein